MSDADILASARGAKMLLENDEMKKAFAAVRENILRRIEDAPIRDREGVHELKLMLKVLGDVKANLQSVLDAGKVIESRISMLDRAKKGLNAFRS